MPTLHATAVAIGGVALLIRGPSRAGKSRLAFALIARSTPRRPVLLVADDRVVLHPRGDELIAAPHPRIAGFMERRGFGIVAMPWTERVPVGGVVMLGTDVAPASLANLPCLEIAAPDDVDASAAAVLSWWLCSAARATHPVPKAHAAVR